MLEMIGLSSERKLIALLEFVLSRAGKAFKDRSTEARLVVELFFFF